MVRFKNRWLLVHFHFPSSPSSPPISSQSLTNALRRSLHLNFGDLGSGALGSSCVCKYYSHNTGTAVIRCAREGLRYVWASLTLMNELGGSMVRAGVSHCSGTIKKIQLRAIALDRARILSARTRSLPSTTTPTSTSTSAIKQTHARNAGAQLAMQALHEPLLPLVSSTGTGTGTLADADAQGTAAALHKSRNEIMAITQ